MLRLKKILGVFLSVLFVLNAMIVLIPVEVSAATSTNWAWPTSLHSVKSDWPTYASGGYHGGTDFPVALNSPVYSTCDGEVVAVTSLTTSYGKHIKIKAVVNGSTVYMRYCHLNSFAVSVGDKVSSGQLIAYSGSTGNSTGPHLHYEVRNANDYYGNASSPNLNPKNYLPGTSYSFQTNNESGGVSVDWTKNNSYPTPITTYPAATSGKITLYNSSLTAYSQSTRYIAYNDLCTINTVYTNGYCSVTYPTSSGTNTEYAKISDFIPNGVTPYSWKPSGNMTTYTRSNMSTVFGSISSADNCTVVGKSGSALQIIYPLNSGGYKLGWITTPADPIPSDFPTPLKAYNVSSSTDTTVYASPDTMNTYYGEIFPTDECTLNAVNISGGWINVTYPVGTTKKTGYVRLNDFVPTNSKLNTFYTTTVTQQSTSYRKPDMATSYGYVSVGDRITVVGKSGNKLQVVYPLDAGGYKLAWIYDTYIVKNLAGISVSSNPSKTTYIEGESLNTSGLVITAKYDDGSTANVTGSCTFSGYSSTPGVKTVTVNYGGKQTAFTVTVKNKSLNSIKIISNPTKTSYYVGDQINMTGIKVQASYDNGDVLDVTNSIYIDENIVSGVGNKQITVTYAYNDVVKTTSFNITVVKPTISLSHSSITIAEGDTISVNASTIPSGQAVTWKSSDTSVVTVSDGTITAKSSGDATISASFIYNGYSYEAKVTVMVLEVADPVYIESISINSMPSKAVYEIGDSFNSTGLSLKIVYSDGTTKIISNGYVISGFDSTISGVKIIEASYSGKSVMFAVTVKETKPSGNPQFVIENITAHRGESITVPIIMKDNPGIISFRLFAAYDKDVLELQNANTKDFADVTFGPLGNHPFVISWSDAIHGDNTENGVVAELTFKVRDTANVGSYPISLSYDEEDIFNSAWENIAFSTSSGSIIVQEGNVAVTGVEAAPENKELTSAGSTFTVAANVFPANATDKKVTFSSNNTQVATVDAQTGLVTAVSNGTAIITVKTNDGDYTDTCIVNVNLPHVHNLIMTPKKSATHVDVGNIEYYTCSGCGKYYKDNLASEEIAISEIVIPATGHSYGDYLRTAEKHWKLCGCGNLSEEAAHTFGGWSLNEDGGLERSCSVCEYTENTNSPNEVDKTILRAEVENAVSEADASKYTSASWSTYKTVLDIAKDVLANENATQEEVDDVLIALISAKANLREVIVLPPEEKLLPYVDVAKSDWFYDAVYYNYLEETMTGMDQTHFGPYGQLSRAQFALILYRIEGEPAVSVANPFKDIVGNEWYANAVLWAQEKGIVTGYLDGRFGPADNITREQMALMMFRYANYCGKDTSEKSDYSNFKDASSVSGFASDAIQWTVVKGIITGKEKGTILDPQGNTARAEVAAIIQRFMNAYAE